MLQNRKNTTGKALAAGLLAAWMSVSPAANASGPNEEPANDVSYTEGSQPAVQQLNPVQLLALARNYSLENNAVGVFINVAPDVRSEGVTGEQIGAIIVSKFKAANIPAAFVLNDAEAGETSVDFFVDGVPYAGYALDRAVEDGFDLVSTKYKALDREPTTFEVASNDL